MGIEVASFISELVDTNPTGADDYATADDHIRLLKEVLQAQFPNFTAAAMNASVVELNKLVDVTALPADINILTGADAAGLTATELAFLNGVTSDIQTQLDAKAASSHGHTASDVSDFDTEVANNSAVAANTAKTSNVTHTGEVTGSGALTIAADAVTLAKMANMATASFLGRNSGGLGNPEVLSATIARAILGVEAGATADQTAGQIEAIVNHDSLVGFVGNEHLRWDLDLGATNLHANNSANGALALASGEVTQLANIGGVSISAANWVLVAALAAASTTVAGVVERATQTEVDARTDSTRFITPATLEGKKLTINTIAGTSDTLAAGDMNDYNEYTNGSAISVVLNTGVGAKGDVVMLEQADAGQITVSGTATLNNANGLKTASPRSVLTLICTATNVWTVAGDATT